MQLADIDPVAVVSQQGRAVEATKQPAANGLPWLRMLIATLGACALVGIGFGVGRSLPRATDSNGGHDATARPWPLSQPPPSQPRLPSPPPSPASPSPSPPPSPALPSGWWSYGEEWWDSDVDWEAPPSDGMVVTELNTYEKDG